MDEKLKQLELLLKRPPSLMQNKDGKWVVEYLNMGIKAADLLGDTQEEAVDKLISFLYRKKQEIHNDRPNSQAI